MKHAHRFTIKSHGRRVKGVCLCGKTGLFFNHHLPMFPHSYGARGNAASKLARKTLDEDLTWAIEQTK